MTKRREAPDGVGAWTGNGDPAAMTGRRGFVLASGWRMHQPYGAVMELHFKTILCPVDFSDTSRHALALAQALARASNGRLVVLFVGAPALMVTDGVMAAPALGAEEPDPDTLKGQLKEFVKSVIGEAAELRVDYGNAADEILEHAAQCQADLIVMGTHGRTGLGRLLMGSVAEHVLRRARCPVLLVKGSSAPAAVEGTAGKSS